jgi:hypothetical protein
VCYYNYSKLKEKEAAPANPTKEDARELKPMVEKEVSR